jgi:hypothetical protein
MPPRLRSAPPVRSLPRGPAILATTQRRAKLCRLQGAAQTPGDTDTHLWRRTKWDQVFEEMPNPTTCHRATTPN